MFIDTFKSFSLTFYSLTLVGEQFQILVVKYDHDLCMYSNLKDGSMRRVPQPLKLVGLLGYTGDDYNAAQTIILSV